MAATTDLSAGRSWEALTGWGVLTILLASLLGGALTFDRRAWPGLLGDEATYLMQAQSLAWDLDLAYEAEDFRRFVEQWQRPPEGLILQSADGGESITYGKPVLYAAWLAPFLRLDPVRGAVVANVLLLGLIAVATAVALGSALGPAAPLWTTAFLFASVMFAHVWWVHADLFLACLGALALCLAYGGGGGRGEGRRRFLARWALAGALLAPLALARPFYGALLLPLVLAVPRDRRRSGWAALTAGLLLVAGLGLAASLAIRGSWTSYGATRMGFYSHTGFPAVDFPVTAWEEKLAERPGTGAWVGEGKLRYPVSPRLLAYDGLYFLFGRHVGILPYFPALLLGFVAFRPRRDRWALLAAVALATLGFFYVRAFNFYGGGGALANRYFLPLYPAFWFLAARRAHPAWALAAGLVAAPFLWPLWTEPRSYPLVQEGGTAYVSTAARELLPYETSLSHLKPAGREDVHHHGLWVKLLAPEPTPGAEGRVFVLSAGVTGELLVGSPAPLETLGLAVEPPPPRGLSVRGGDLGSPRLAEGSLVYPLALDRHTARHRMWWTFDDVWLYRLEIEHRGDRPLTFRLAPTVSSSSQLPAASSPAHPQAGTSWPTAGRRRPIAGSSSPLSLAGS